MKELFENKLFRMCMISIIVIILIIIILVAIVGGGSKKITEYGLISAAKRYYQNNPSFLPKENYESATVSVPTLVSTGYISSKASGSTCPSYATVVNMNGTYEYYSTLLCDNNGTYTTLLNKIMSNITTNGSGLYNINGKYIFRGENPNNYVKFANSLWRIIGIDENNNIKMIYSDIYTEYQAWDDRYNKEIDDQRGVNEYVRSEKSRIKEFLDNLFTNEIYIENFTFDRIAMLAKHNVCIGKINIETNNVNACSKTLSNERVTAITVNDYVNASLDPACSIKNSINCQNYNFLSNNGWTVNASSANSYDVYYIDAEEGLKTGYASFGNAIRPVISIKNSAIYAGGTGTVLDPYTIK